MLTHACVIFVFALQMVRKVREQLPTAKKNPVLLVDIERIIKYYDPKDLKNKTAKISLFLTTLGIGARAVTMRGIRLCDILECSPHGEGNGLYTIRMNLDCEKGKRKNWNKEVRLTGNVFGQPTSNDLPSDQDPLYWLTRHLKETFSLDVLNIDQWDLNGKENHKLWTLSRGQMRRSIQTAAYIAGYARHYFCFHSLRCGFLAMALYKAGLDSNRLEDVLQFTAWVAGWDPRSNAQLRYLHELAQSWIDASAVMNPLVRVRVIDPRINSVEGLHGKAVLTHPPVVRPYAELIEITPILKLHCRGTQS